MFDSKWTKFLFTERYYDFQMTTPKIFENIMKNPREILREDKILLGMSFENRNISR